MLVVNARARLRGSSWGAAVLVLFAVALSIPASAQTWTAAFDTEVRYFSWHSTRGFPSAPIESRGSGTQVYAPLSFQFSGNPSPDAKFEFLLRSGYVSAKQTTLGQSGAVHTPTDTTLTPTFTYLGWDFAQPFTSVTLNLPTGKTVLFGNSRFARMDSDLVDIPTFGEGFNVGPTIGANIPITPSLILTLSAGYTWRGAFDKEGPTPTPPLQDQGTQRADPGDVATVSASLGYQAGPFSAVGTVSYSRESATTLDAVPQYRAGQRFMVTGATGYVWSDAWSSALNASWSHSGKNDALNPNTMAFAPEEFNSNSNVYRVGFEHTYRSGGFSAGPAVSWLYRDRNGYDAINMLFVPAKTRWSAGGVARYALTNMVNINSRVERIWTEEKNNPEKFDFDFNSFIPGSAIPQVSSRGWMISAGATINFEAMR